MNQITPKKRGPSNQQALEILINEACDSSEDDVNCDGGLNENDVER